MAITPRTILTSAAPATVAVVSLYLFTALGTTAYKLTKEARESIAEAERIAMTDVHHASVMHRAQACNDIIDVYGPQKHRWSEQTWVMFAGCFDQRNDSRMVIATASHGLRYHPDSEILYNLAGYHQILLGEHDQAIQTLRTGMRNVQQPRNGIMANNLAWAGLWEPRLMRSSEARHLYSQSLAMTPNSCETLHTGLFVEYAIATRSNGVERFDALKRFDDLRQRYEPCMSRINTGEWNTLVEVVGAAVLFDEVDQGQPSNGSFAAMEAVTSKLRENYRGTSVEVICREAIPLAEVHHTCVDKVQTTAAQLRQAERAAFPFRTCPKRTN
jgi:hypothetical protein